MCVVWRRCDGPYLGLTECDANVGQEAVHLVHDFLAGDLAPALLVGRVGQQGQVHLLHHLLKVVQRVLAHVLHSHQLVHLAIAQLGVLTLHQAHDLGLGQLLWHAQRGVDAVCE